MKMTKEQEDVWRKISALLMDNDENNPQEISIPIGEEDSIGMSSLDLLWTEYIFQDPKEGMILVKIDGYDYPTDLSELPDSDIENILNELIDIKGFTPKLID